MSAQPTLKIQVFRGDFPESEHDLSICVVNSKNEILLNCGDIQQNIFPRSAIKALQALALFRSGAFEKFHPTPQELSLACASHSAEKFHTEAIKTWLKKLQLEVTSLECGAHLPSDQEAAIELLKSGQNFSALHNNCSGKHTGFLATALALETPPQQYIEFDHPVQKLVRQILSEYTEIELTREHSAIDGCSIPTYSAPLSNWALAMARFADDKFLAPEALSRQQLFSAMISCPEYIAGSRRYCTLMTRELNTQTHVSGFVKTGAEGVMMASLASHGLGIAIKSHDGASRSAELAMTWALHQLGLLSDKSWQNLKEPELKNWNQIKVGTLRVLKPCVLNLTHSN